MTHEEFIEEIKKLGIKLTNNQEEKLNKFYKLLIEWNEKINLTRTRRKRSI